MQDDRIEANKSILNYVQTEFMRQQKTMLKERWLARSREKDGEEATGKSSCLRKKPYAR